MREEGVEVVDTGLLLAEVLGFVPKRVLGCLTTRINATRISGLACGVSKRYMDDLRP